VWCEVEIRRSCVQENLLHEENSEDILPQEDSETLCPPGVWSSRQPLPALEAVSSLREQIVPTAQLVRVKDHGLNRHMGVLFLLLRLLVICLHTVQ